MIHPHQCEREALLPHLLQLYHSHSVHLWNAAVLTMFLPCCCIAHKSVAYSNLCPAAGLSSSSRSVCFAMCDLNSHSLTSQAHAESTAMDCALKRLSIPEQSRFWAAAVTMYRMMQELVPYQKTPIFGSCLQAICYRLSQQLLSATRNLVLSVLHYQ